MICGAFEWKTISRIFMWVKFRSKREGARGSEGDYDSRRGWDGEFIFEDSFFDCSCKNIPKRRLSLRDDLFAFGFQWKSHFSHSIPSQGSRSNKMVELSSLTSYSKKAEMGLDVEICILIMPRKLVHISSFLQHFPLPVHFLRWE